VPKIKNLSCLSLFPFEKWIAPPHQNFCGASHLNSEKNDALQCVSLLHFLGVAHWPAGCLPAFAKCRDFFFDLSECILGVLVSIDSHPLQARLPTLTPHQRVRVKWPHLFGRGHPTHPGRQVKAPAPTPWVFWQGTSPTLYPDLKTVLGPRTGLLLVPHK